MRCPGRMSGFRVGKSGWGHDTRATDGEGQRHATRCSLFQSCERYLVMRSEEEERS